MSVLTGGIPLLCGALAILSFSKALLDDFFSIAFINLSPYLSNNPTARSNFGSDCTLFSNEPSLIASSIGFKKSFFAVSLFPPNLSPKKSSALYSSSTACLRELGSGALDRLNAFAV